jgi:transposase-like protein
VTRGTSSGTSTRTRTAGHRRERRRHREILGLQVTSAEDGAGWLGFFRDLTARGLTGVALVTSDAHRGLVDAIGATLPGAGWQRGRTH